MQKFPPEFSDLLNARGKRVAARVKPMPHSARNPLLALHDGLMDAATARECVRLLDRKVYPLLRPMVDPIPPDSISGMKRNYTETLPKTVSVKTCYLSSRRFRAYGVAEKIGLIEMLHSASVQRFAEAVTGLKLTRPTAQVICYEHGDYSGPHNDHHPENETSRHGFVDLHIMFGNDAVEHQWIVYEQDGHFRNIRNVNLQGGVAVYRLPFWHYTTPLAGKRGREKQARRWLLLVTYDIARG